MQRVNFVEREPFGLITYRKMILAGGVIVGLVVVIVGAQVTRGVLLGQEASRLEAEVKKLRAEQEKIFKESESAGGSADAREVLINLIDSAPPWSMILRELAARTPRSVWLTKLKSIPQTASAASQASQAPRGIELSGHADDAGRVAQFVKALQGTSLFGDVVLTSSKKEKDASASAYEFVINLSVQSAKGKGL